MEPIKYSTAFYIAIILPVFVLAHDPLGLGAWIIAIILFAPVYLTLLMTFDNLNSTGEVTSFTGYKWP